MTDKFLKASGKYLLVISLPLSAAFYAFGQCGSDGLQKCPTPKPVQNPSSTILRPDNSSASSRPKPAVIQTKAKIPTTKLSSAERQERQFVAKAEDCRFASDYDCAIANYTSAINVDPREAGNYYMRGVSYEQRASVAEKKQRTPEQKASDYNEALKDYSKSIELNPSEGGFYEGRADLYLTLSKDEQALADYTKVIKLNNSDNVSLVYKKRSRIYEKLNRLDEAIDDQTARIAADLTGYKIGLSDDYKRRADLYQLRAAKFETAEDAKRAKDYYELAINDLKESYNQSVYKEGQGENLLIRGKLYLKVANLTEAQNILSTAIEMKPPQIAAYYDARGDVHMALSKKSEKSGAIISPGYECQLAAADYENALKNYSKNKFYYLYKLGTANLCWQKYDEAVKNFSEAIQLKPDDANLYDWRRLAYEKLGKTDLARADRLKFEQLKNGKTN